jgi:nicotinamidase-related amidase
MVAVVEGKFVSDPNDGPRVFDNPVLIVRNMQNGLLREAFDREDLIYNVRDLIAVAHRNAVPVVFSQHHSLPGRWTDMRTKELLRTGEINGKDDWMRIGSPEWRIVSILKPEPDDLVLPSHEASLFSGTPLEHMLHFNGIRTIILAGLSSHTGILVTARKASMLGFAVVVAEDAVGGKSREEHRQALHLLNQGCEVITTTEASERFDRPSIRNVLPPALLGWKDPTGASPTFNGPLSALSASLPWKPRV